MKKLPLSLQFQKRASSTSNRSTSQRGFRRPKECSKGANFWIWLVCLSGRIQITATSRAREARTWRGFICLILPKIKCNEHLQEIWEQWLGTVFFVVVVVFYHAAWHVQYYLPDQEWNLCPLQWNQGIIATRLPWKSHTKYLLDHSGTKLEINNTRKTGDYTWWKPNSTLLNNQKKSKEKSKNASEQMKIETQFTRTYGLLQKLF